MEDILGMIKNTVSGVVMNNDEVPREKQEQTVNVASEAIKDGFKQNLRSGNMDNIISLFKGNGNTGSNPVVSGTIQNVVNSLVQKVGLSPAISNSIANKVVPAVVNLFSGKVNDPSNKMDMNSLTESFLGSKTKNNNLLKSIGKWFNK
jgi:hypothetical protein